MGNVVRMVNEGDMRMANEDEDGGADKVNDSGIRLTCLSLKFGKGIPIC